MGRGTGTRDVRDRPRLRGGRSGLTERRRGATPPRRRPDRARRPHRAPHLRTHSRAARLPGVRRVFRPLPGGLLSSDVVLAGDLGPPDLGHEADPRAAGVIVFCRSGLRASVAAAALRRPGHDVVEHEGSAAGTTQSPPSPTARRLDPPHHPPTTAKARGPGRARPVSGMTKGSGGGEHPEGFQHSTTPDERCPAATYSPTPSRVQYHRRDRA